MNRTHGATRVFPAIAFLALMFFSFLFGGCSKVESPEKFTAEYVTALKKACPDVEIKVIRPLLLEFNQQGRGPWNVFLNNAYDTYKQTPKEKKAIIGIYIASVSKLTVGQDTAKDDANNIVPVIKDADWVDDMERLLKQQGTTSFARPIFEKLNDKLLVAYAVDSASSVSYLNDERLKKLGLQCDANLRKRAVENLSRIGGSPQVKDCHGFFLITCGGNYEASLILSESVWEGMAPHVKGDIVFAVPERSVLMVTGSDDKQGLEQVRKIISSVNVHEAYGITDALFTYKNGKIEVFKQ
jgi:uncharacterized protein YtpQ (UPF0354 family)